jgi:hypothetical protein
MEKKLPTETKRNNNEKREAGVKQNNSHKGLENVTKGHKVGVLELFFFCFMDVFESLVKCIK